MQTIVEAAKVVPIEDVAQRLGLVFRRGSWCCCPLHEEKTPSFHVRPGKGTWRCFGCGEGGDGIDLVCAVRKCSFLEALEWYRTELGISGEGTGPAWARPRKISDRERPWLVRPDVLRESFAMSWGTYEPYMREITRYVLERGLVLETCRVRRLGHDRELLRALWPIVDREGVLRGVSGRLYVDGCLRCDHPLAPSRDCPACGYVQPPKWLHTIGMDRDLVLYGEDAMVGDDVGILVEGLIDRDVLWQAGWTDVLATMGTSVSTEHARKVVAWFRRLVIFADGDEAGRKMAATWKEIVGRRMSVAVVETPEGEDPGSLDPWRASELLRAVL